MRIFAAAMALMAAIILGVSAYMAILNTHLDHLEAGITQIEEDVAQDNWPEALATADKLISTWEKSEKWISMFTNHTEINTVSEAFARLRQYIIFEDRKEVLVSTSILHILAEGMSKNESFSLQNLF